MEIGKPLTLKENIELMKEDEKYMNENETKEIKDLIIAEWFLNNLSKEEQKIINIASHFYIDAETEKAFLLKLYNAEDFLNAKTGNPEDFEYALWIPKSVLLTKEQKEQEKTERKNNIEKNRIYKKHIAKFLKDAGYNDKLPEFISNKKLFELAEQKLPAFDKEKLINGVETELNGKK